MACIDNRQIRMAQVLVRYSLDVQPGNLVAIQGGVEAIPLLREVYRETLRAGAHPELLLEMEEAREIYLKEAEEYWEFIFSACMLNQPDPVAYWRGMAEQQKKLIAWLKGRKQVHILGEDTDLTLSIEGRPFLPCDGHINLPDGEIYTGPVEDSANGIIRFALPSSYDGHAVDDIRLRFEGGRVVEVRAATGQDYLLSMLSIDAGARRIGEFAFGMNYGIREATGNILYDEKIGGTIHIALGRSYPASGGLNVSALHWDMVCDLRRRGEVWVDGELFLRDGRFVVV